MSRANESAFPIQESDLAGSIPAQHGLTIREHFALEIFKASIVGKLAYDNLDRYRTRAIEEAAALLAELAKAVT